MLRTSWGRTKPPIGVRINRGDPLGAGLIHATLAVEIGSVGTRDSVLGATGTRTGTAPWGSGLRGPEVQFNAGYIEYAQSRVQFPTTGLSVVICTSLGAETRYGLCANRWSPDSNTGFSFEVSTNTSGAELLIGSTSEASYNNDLINSPMYLTGHHTFVATWQAGSRSRVYQDGILRADAAATSTALTSSAGNLFWGSNRPDRTSDLVGNFVFGYIYDRALTASEVLRLQSTPYAMFMPPTLRLPKGVAVAATTKHYGTLLGVGA